MDANIYITLHFLIILPYNRHQPVKKCRINRICRWNIMIHSMDSNDILKTKITFKEYISLKDRMMLPNR
ncbi:hypothetical protein HMPREF3213_02811 [Heyndrickxia coagulans]|uniref:Uncharacterized protein n=1 Tax=Heyndrickxia coagulans TaxID=1398 RepID=A0A133KHT4_HEYCO|nr:hypothetical protein HMPREF3213_02811 [Heyndrickxia coagulans]